MKRKLWIMLIMAALMAGMQMLPVSAASDQAKIKKVINYYMNGVKSSKVKKAAKAFNNPKLYRMRQYIIVKQLPALKKLYKKNKEIKYKIGYVAVKDGKASVKMKVKFPSIGKAVAYALGEYVYYLWTHKVSDKNAMKVFNSCLKKGIKAKGIQMVNCKVVINMVKVGNTWKIMDVSDYFGGRMDLIYGQFPNMIKGFNFDNSEFSKPIKGFEDLMPAQ